MKRKLLEVLFFCVGILFLYLAFRNVPLQEFLEGFKEVEWQWIGLAMLVGVLSHWLRSERWRLLLKFTEGYNMRRDVAFYSVMTGYFVNLFLPRAGEVIRCTLGGRASRIPVIYLIGTVLAERIIDMLILALLIIIVLWLQWDMLGDFVLTSVVEPLTERVKTILSPSFGLLAAATLVIFVIVIVSIKQVLRRAPLSFRVKRMLVNLRNALKQFMLGVNTVFSLPLNKQLLFWLNTAGIWIMYILMTYMPARGFHYTETLSLNEVLGIFVYGALGIVAPVQGGIGTYHWLVQQAMILYGYDKIIGLQLATLIHAAQIIMITVVGGISYFLLTLKVRSS